MQFADVFSLSSPASWVLWFVVLILAMYFARTPAHRVIEATGLVAAPGFIDIHTHSDFTLPLNPRAEGKIRQGVTTEVVGNCGFSVAPALPGRVEVLRE